MLLVAIPVIAGSDAQLHRLGVPLDMKVKLPTACLSLLVAVDPGIGERLLAGLQSVAHEHCGRTAPHRLTREFNYGDTDQLQHPQPELRKGLTVDDRAGHRAHRDHRHLSDGAGGGTGPRVRQQRQSA